MKQPEMGCCLLLVIMDVLGDFHVSSCSCGTLQEGVRTEVLPPGWRMEWVKRKKNERVMFGL